MIAHAPLSDRVLALMARERLTRFSGGRIGPLWALLAPIAWIAFIVILFRALNRTPPIYVGAEIFVATGVLPYILFRQTVTSLTRSVVSHRYMLYIRPVGFAEILLATGLLEALNMVVAALAILATVTLLFQAPLPSDPSMVALGFGLAWILAAGFGRFTAVVSLMSDSFARLVPLLLRPLFWLSGIFYTATELPLGVQNILWFSPLLHATEFVRQGYFNGYTSPVATVWLPVALGCAFYLISLPLERFARRHKLIRYKL